MGYSLMMLVDGGDDSDSIIIIIILLARWVILITQKLFCWRIHIAKIGMKNWFCQPIPLVWLDRLPIPFSQLCLGWFGVLKNYMHEKYKQYSKLPAVIP